MVDILEIPIQSKMRGKFMQFFKLTASKQDDWEFDGIISSEELKVPLHPYPNISPSCDVCLHGLKRIAIFKNKHTNKLKGLGTICGSNLMAIQKYDGDLDKLNYDRLVKLQKKTIIKRMLEYQAQRGKIILEMQYHEEMNWLYQLIEEAQIRYEDYFLGHYHTDTTFSPIYKYHLEFFLSLYNQVERKGKLSTKQIEAIRKNMNAQSVEDRLAKLDKILIETWVKVSKKRMMEVHYDTIRSLTTPYKHPLNEWQRKVTSDLKDWFEKNRYYTEKQMGLVVKIAGQVKDDYVKYIEAESERWAEHLLKLGVE